MIQPANSGLPSLLGLRSVIIYTCLDKLCQFELNVDWFTRFTQSYSYLYISNAALPGLLGLPQV